MQSSACQQACLCRVVLDEGVQLVQVSIGTSLPDCVNRLSPRVRLLLLGLWGLDALLLLLLWHGTRLAGLPSEMSVGAVPAVCLLQIARLQQREALCSASYAHNHSPCRCFDNNGLGCQLLAKCLLRRTGHPHTASHFQTSIGSVGCPGPGDLTASLCMGFEGCQLA